MELVSCCMYYFAFIFLVHVSCTAIAGACDVFKIRIRGDK